MEKDMNKASKQFKNKINFYKVNVFKVDDYTMEKLEIPGVPSTGIFYDGEYDIQGGMATIEEMEEIFEELSELSDY
jgi:hypothetical protein